MQETARSNHAACQSFFTVRRAPWLCARRSTALVLTRTCCSQSRLSGIPRFDMSGRPASVARGSRVSVAKVSSPERSVTLHAPGNPFTGLILNRHWENYASTAAFSDCNCTAVAIERVHWPGAVQRNHSLCFPALRNPLQIVVRPHFIRPYFELDL